MSGLLIDLRIAVLNLLEHRRRTASVGTAIAVVTCLFVLLTALSAGIRQTLLDTASTLTTGHLNVGGVFKINAGQATAIVVDADKVADVVRRNVPELDFMVSRGRGWGQLVTDHGWLPAALSGIDIASEPMFKRVVQISSGNIDELAQPNTILLFEKQAKKLDLKVGDALTISTQTARGSANTIDCRVVAIARELGLLSSFTVFISHESLRNLSQLRSNVTGAIQIHVKPDHLNDLAPIAARLRRALEQAGYRLMESDGRMLYERMQAIMLEQWTGQKLDVTTWEEELSFMMWTFRALQALSLVLIVILFAIMIAGITNALWIAVRERTREIGTLRAIGMQRAGVARLFLLEAGMLGVLGALAGVALGVLIASLINAGKVHVPIAVQLFLMRDTVNLCIEPRTLIAAIVLITFATATAALYPSLRAARRRPVDAMAHFG